MKYHFLIISFLLIQTGLLVSCTPSISIEKQCSFDSDCVAATCCHAQEVVNKNYAPNCTGQMCTMECAPDTLDCGQGEIKCSENQCQVMIKE